MVAGRKMAKAQLRPRASSPAPAEDAGGLLSPLTARVLAEVPRTWTAEAGCIASIALTVPLSVSEVRRRIQNLTRAGYVNRRRAPGELTLCELRRITP